MKKTLKQVRQDRKEAKEQKRFNRDLKNGNIEIGITAKGWALFHNLSGSESSFETDKILNGKAL